MCPTPSSVPALTHVLSPVPSYSFSHPDGVGLSVGTFTFDTRTSVWHWDDHMFAIHGFQPGDIVPSTRLMLAHKHPEDRAAFDRLFTRLCTEGGEIVSLHRILDARGKLRKVLLMAHAAHQASLCRELITGRMVDLSASMRLDAVAYADESVARAVEKRHVIEQAKGIIMHALRVDAETAFSILAEKSQQSHQKLRDVAELIVSQNSHETEATPETRSAAAVEPQPHEGGTGAGRPNKAFSTNSDKAG